ncbi:MAG: ABC transporter ATP-binding protein, partial [Sphingobacteriaceae bacterium]
MARARLNSGNTQEQDLPKAKLNRESLHKISKLLVYIKPYRGRFFAALVFLFLTSLTGLAFPSFLGALIDAAQGKQRYAFLPPTVNAIGTLAFVVLLFQAAVSYFRVVW